MSSKEYAPEWLEFEKELGYHPQLHGPLENAFTKWNSLLGDLVSKFEFPPPDTSVKTTEHQLEGPGTAIRVYHPPKNSSGEISDHVSLFVYIHGGGWCMGDLDAEDSQPRLIAKQLECVVVAIDYRLAPTHKFPVPVEDCVCGIRWAIQNSSKLGATNDHVVIVGESAGANLAIAAALKIIDEGKGEKLKGLAAILPVTIHPEVVPIELKDHYRSFYEEAQCPIDTADAMMAFWNAYTTTPEHPYVSVLLHKRLNQLPPTYIVATGKDTLCDDALLFKRALDKEGVPAKLDEYPRLPHYFWTFPSKALAGKTAEFNSNLIEGLHFILRTT